VLARDVTVTVLGTIFSVGLEPGGVRVTVERGRVHVAWPAGERVLRIGEEAFIPDMRVEPPAPAEAAEEAPASPTDENVAPTPAAETPPAVAPPSAQRAAAPSSGAGPAGNSAGGVSWRTLAQDGDYTAAYSRMQADRSGSVRDEPGDLLLAADVARLGGHPNMAIAPLQQVIEKHSSDSRAPLAAFTLGRTLLDQLGRPREAAAAFAKARKLEPHGAMAQDALAREVESWSRAGEASLARERAEQYVSSYPKGRRLGAVKRLGGLD
jgi:transmembrane sensor